MFVQGTSGRVDECRHRLMCSEGVRRVRADDHLATCCAEGCSSGKRGWGPGGIRRGLWKSLQIQRGTVSPTKARRRSWFRWGGREESLKPGGAVGGKA